MALLHLLARIGPQAGWQVFAVTVDHGLRPEARAEAALVAAACAKIGVAHTVLAWHRTATTGNLQDQAARGRYALMTAWAKARGLATMALGHTADDQAETFLMQLAREAGIDGLSGMRQSWTQDGVRWTRPLLGQRRRELRDYLDRNCISWVDDPSNDNARFDRVRVRQFMPELKRLGITVDVLAGVAGQLASVRNALNACCRKVADRIVIQTGGDLIFQRQALLSCEPEVRRRLLNAALRWVSGSEYSPRRSAQFALDQAILHAKAKTLSGCRISCTQAEIRISRELNALRSHSAATTELWDNRWQCAGPHDPSLHIRVLGEGGLRHCPDWRLTGLPRYSLLASPAIWQGDTLIAAPLAGHGNEWSAQIVADFHTSPLSH